MIDSTRFYGSKADVISPSLTNIAINFNVSLVGLFWIVVMVVSMLCLVGLFWIVVIVVIYVMFIIFACLTTTTKYPYVKDFIIHSYCPFSSKKIGLVIMHLTK